MSERDLPIVQDDVQGRIIEGALAVFGRNTYKRASTADIAAEAGVAKSMIFYYFGSKKKLYLYLLDFCVEAVTEGMGQEAAGFGGDFFDRIRHLTQIKIAAMKRHPAISSFLKNVYMETDEEVAADVVQFFANSQNLREKLMYEGTDTSRFLDPAAPKLLEKFLLWASEGYLGSMRIGDMDALESFAGEFLECLELLKRNFYKE